MLRFLKISRLAVIDAVEVEFERGFNVLTGETGAGKSILVEAVGLLLGGRASGDLVRTGEEAAAIEAIPGLDRSKLLLFGGWESASRGAGSTLQMTGERLGITEQFQGVDQITPRDDGGFEVLERVEGGKHQRSRCAAAPAVVGWATGHLGEPRNDPGSGMQNMRLIRPAVGGAEPAKGDGARLQRAGGGWAGSVSQKCRGRDCYWTWRSRRM